MLTASATSPRAPTGFLMEWSVLLRPVTFFAQVMAEKCTPSVWMIRGPKKRPLNSC